MGLRERLIGNINRLIENPVTSTTAVLVLLTLLVVGLTIAHGGYDDHFVTELLVAAHGTLFEIFALGLLILWLTRQGEKRTAIRKCLDEIEDHRGLRDDMVVPRLRRCILNLNKEGITEVDLSDCHLKKVDLAQTSLDRSDLRRANLAYATLVDMSLESAQMEEADLVGADLSRANLRGAKLTRAKLTDAKLQEADLRGTSLEDTNITESLLRGARYDDDTKLPPGVDRTRMAYLTAQAVTKRRGRLMALLFGQRAKSR